MALEKQKKLRKVEIIFTDDMVNPICHCEYDVVILEDGQEIQRKKHRENEDIDLSRETIANAEKYVPVNELL